MAVDLLFEYKCPGIIIVIFLSVSMFCFLYLNLRKGRMDTYMEG